MKDISDDALEYVNARNELKRANQELDQVRNRVAEQSRRAEEAGKKLHRLVGCNIQKRVIPLNGNTVLVRWNETNECALVELFDCEGNEVH